MDEHLKRAWKYLQEMEAPGKRPSPIQLAVEEIFFYLNRESQLPQEAPQASETSSAPTTGPVVRRWEWSSGTLGVHTASLEETRESFRLTVETGVSSKSTQYTRAEWGAICQLFSTLPPIPELPTPSTETITVGGRGVAAPEPSPAPSHEGWCRGTGDERCELAVAGHVACADYIRCVFPSQSSQEGAQD